MKTARIAVSMLYAVPALAHGGEPLQPHDLWTAWTFAPAMLLPLLLTAALYLRGARRARGVTARQAWCFWSGWAVLTLALVSPLHALGEVLFSAHMVQHELLMLVAAPLLVLSRPLPVFLWALPFDWRRAAGRWSKFGPLESGWSLLTQPLGAWLVHAAALWCWHAPLLFQATLSNDWIHAAQHLSFFGSALLFWWALLYAWGRRGYGLAVLYVFTTALHTSVLGVLLTFAPVLIYPAYSSRSAAWGVPPLEDQQAGGLIMWVPAGLVYVAAGLALFAAWLRASDGWAEANQYAE